MIFFNFDRAGIARFFYQQKIFIILILDIVEDNII